MATELDVSLTHKYEPLITTRQQNLFTEEFFAGPDVSIHFNGLEQRNISQIQYTVQEQLKPIYGYDSMLFDDIAVGSRIVVGTFVMPIYNVKNNDSVNTLENLSKVQEKLPSWIVQSHSKTPVATTRFEASPKVSKAQRLLKQSGSYSASEYDNVGITAINYDVLQLTAYEYDWFSNRKVTA